jgi:hypothetical protein
MTTLEKFKLGAIIWNSDTHPDDYAACGDQMGSLCSATQGGAALENYYRAKVGKSVKIRVAVPSYLLDDPDFAGTTPFNLIGASAESSAESSDPLFQVARSTSSGASGSINSLHPASLKYMNLPPESRTLDALLYNVLLMNVKGSKNALLRCVASPSYVYGKIVLNKHMDISRSERKTRAFSHMDELKCRGDPHAFEVKAVGAWREITESKCTMKDYAMTRIMKAFDGVSKTTQRKIARDLNNNDLDSLNYFDLIHGYCSDLASVGDHRQQVNNTSDATDSPNEPGACPFCGMKGHTESDCYHKKAASKAAKEKSKQKCNKCGKLGHSNVSVTR